MSYNNTYIINNDLTKEDLLWIESNCDYISIDTETTGLNPIEDSLCLIQIKAKDVYYLVKFNKEENYRNLVKLLENKMLVKVFHHAIFDVRFLVRNLEIEEIDNIACTKISAKMLGVKENSLQKLLVKFLNVEIDKDQMKSNWCQEKLSSDQIRYAKNDVKYLLPLWWKIKNELIYKKELSFVQRCFNFIPVQVYIMNQKKIDNIFLH